MRRALVLIVFAGMATLVGALGLRPGSSPADPALGRMAASAPKPEALQLPITQTVLFSSGVGYYQREGQVEGNARIDLTFPVQDINDLLKSMVLQDLDGGRVAAVSCESRDPVQKTLRSFAIDLTGNPGYGEVLNQARGEKVEVILQSSNTSQPGTLNGTIMGVEKQKQPAGKEGSVDVELLNLWCTEGMRGVKLSDVQRVRFLNPVLEGEVRRALEVLSLSHDMQKKAVSLSFEGDGKRHVKVSYVVESPIWKTSYRLALGKDNKLFLQAWAVVENPSDEDWNGVRMALVSGRPVSFQMDLYQPIYIPRPAIEPELFASLRPPTYTGPMDKYGANPVVSPDLNLIRDEKKPLKDLNDAEAQGPAERRASRPANSPADAFKTKRLDEAKKGTDSLGDQGVASAATAADLGDYFQYVIDHPVTLPRQKSALLPVLNKDVQGTRVSIYNEATLAKHPLLGLRFKNTTGIPLTQGPVTVFDQNSYAGDARILDLQKGEERLLSYAIDLGTEVEPVAKREPDRFTAVKITKGILQTTIRERETKTYNIKNRSEQDRVVLIEHAFRPDFKLVDKTMPRERARDVYRFEAKVAAGKSASQEVTEERDILSQTALTNLTDETIRLVFNSTVASPRVVEAIKKGQELKLKAAETQRELALAEQQLADIERDQQRLRANLKETPPTAEAYKKYLAKLDAQETEVDKLMSRIKELRREGTVQKKAYDNYLANLSVE
jgi:hypothetical protein